MKIYVATSWRNERQPAIVAMLRADGHEVYDFRNPAPGDHGFHWDAIDPVWQQWGPAEYVQALEHPVAEAGFDKDMGALSQADAVVLVLPCGKSAHLEAGWAVGAGKRLFILLEPEDRVEPELMYKMTSRIHCDMAAILCRLRMMEGRPEA